MKIGRPGGVLSCVTHGKISTLERSTPASTPATPTQSTPRTRNTSSIDTNTTTPPRFCLRPPSQNKQRAAPLAASAAGGDNGSFGGGGGEEDDAAKLPTDVDIDQLLLELAGMDAGRQYEDRSGERSDDWGGRVEDEGWQGEEGGGGFGGGAPRFADGGGQAEEKGWKRKRNRRKRKSDWDPEVRGSVQAAAAVTATAGTCCFA